MASRFVHSILLVDTHKAALSSVDFLLSGSKNLNLVGV